MWKKSYQRFDWSYDIFSHVKKVVSAFWLADIFLPKKFNTCSQANVNMESDFVNLLRREFMIFCLQKILKDYEEIHLWFH